MTLSSLLVLTVTPANVSASANLAVPLFNVKLVDYSYDLKPNATTIVDQYTGKETTTAYSSCHIVDRTIEVAIKNQPFTPYTDKHNHTTNIYYDIEVTNLFDEKHHFFEKIQSDSEFTVERFSANHFTNGTQLLFRVKAKIGYWYDLNEGQIISDVYGIKDPRFFIQEQSEWSSVQTFTIPIAFLPSDSTPQTSEINDSPITSDGNQTLLTDFIPARVLLGVIALLLCAIVVLAVLFIRRHTKTFDINNNTASQTNNI